MDQAQQSQRLRRLAALCWVLGLSFRRIAGVFAVFGAGISRMTAWRDEQEWVWVVAEIKQLLGELPIEGSRRLLEL